MTKGDRRQGLLRNNHPEFLFSLLGVWPLTLQLGAGLALELCSILRSIPGELRLRNIFFFGGGVIGLSLFLIRY